MSEIKETIHIRIRDLRREHSLTQEELAEALGLSRQSINAMEAGRCLPSLPVALQIASYFSVPLHAVFAAKEIPQIVKEDVATQTISSLEPWAPLKEMREALDELMDDRNFQHQPQMSVPAVNVYQNANNIIVDIQVPGFTKEALAIEVGEDFLTVTATFENEAEEYNYFRREYSLSSFARTIALPAIVESDRAEAEIVNGILRVSIPKLIEERPKTSRISIKSV